jgi:inosine-uridine nucleoside N-ribohydrolase
MKKHNCYIQRNDELNNDCLDASNFIIEQVNKYPNEVTVISLGALTNVSKALKIEPKISLSIKRIVFMGSGVVPNFKSVPEEFEISKEYHCHSCHNVIIEFIQF